MESVISSFVLLLEDLSAFCFPTLIQVRPNALQDFPPWSGCAARSRRGSEGGPIARQRVKY